MVRGAGWGADVAATIALWSVATVAAAGAAMATDETTAEAAEAAEASMAIPTEIPTRPAALAAPTARRVRLAGCGFFRRRCVSLMDPA